MQDGNAVPAADLAADGAHPETQVTDQNPVAVLRRPDDMVTVVIDAMRGAIILHDHVLPEMSLRPERAAHFRKDRDITRFVLAEAISDWKSEASNQRVESESRPREGGASLRPPDVPRGPDGAAQMAEGVGRAAPERVMDDPITLEIIYLPGATREMKAAASHFIEDPQICGGGGGVRSKCSCRFLSQFWLG